MTLHHIAAREGELLSFLRGELSLSSGLVKRLKWQNALFLDGQPVHTNARVRPGQTITVLVEESPEGFLPERLPIDILYEDEYLIALDKPAGHAHHAVSRIQSRQRHHRAQPDLPAEQTRLKRLPGQRRRRIQKQKSNAAARVALDELHHAPRN